MGVTITDRSTQNNSNFALFAKAPQSFAELDPDCFGRVLGAGESFRGGAEACWLSLTWSRRLS